MISKKFGWALILLSTYNGEKYLEEQINSLLKQENVSVFILIRDDGSTDGTVEILKEYADKHENIDIVEGENVGVINSFNTLMNHPLVDEFEYVAFCDQDDIWLPGKISSALDRLDSGKREVPQLYCSNLQVVDEKLSPIKLYHTTAPNYNRCTAIVQNCATGCTQVFNRRAVQLYRDGIGKRMEMHDYWMFLVCVYMGQVFWDKNAFILYRQHMDNVVGAKDKSVQRAISNVRNVAAGKRQKMITDFLDAYDGYLDEDEKKILRLIKEYDSNWYERLKLVFSPRYHGYDYRVTLGFKFRALSGRIY